MALFKKCADCSTIVQSNEHSSCLLGLGELHNTVNFVYSFTPKARQERAQRLKAALWEKAVGVQSLKLKSTGLSLRKQLEHPFTAALTLLDLLIVSTSKSSSMLRVASEPSAKKSNEPKNISP